VVCWRRHFTGVSFVCQGVGPTVKQLYVTGLHELLHRAHSPGEAERISYHVMFIPTLAGEKDKHQTRRTRVSLAFTPSHDQSPSPSRSDFQRPQAQGATEGTSARGSAPHQSSARRPEDAQARSGHHSEDEQQDRTSSQASGYGWFNNYIRVPAPPEDKYQIPRDALGNYKRELARVTGELRETNHHYGLLQHENQRLKDSINGFTKRVDERSSATGRR
jgi:hypothetical protein